MKVKRLIISALMVTALCAFSDPFSSEWNWEGTKLQGKVKRITTPTKVEEFNERGQKTLSKLLNKDGSVKYETTLLYNDSGNLWKVIFRKTGDDNPMYTETASYSSEGALESVKREGRKGDEGYAEEIKYDANGHIESISAKMGTKGMTWTYRFSEEGILQSSQLLTDGSVKSETAYTPNENGDPVKIESKRNGKTSYLAEIEYQYDDHGNWITKTRQTTAYRGDKVIQPAPHTETRKIEYY